MTYTFTYTSVGICFLINTKNKIFAKGNRKLKTNHAFRPEPETNGTFLLNGLRAH
jgi:hypothetical protein